MRRSGTCCTSHSSPPTRPRPVVRATGLTVGKAGRVPFDSLIAFGWNAPWAHLLRGIPGEPVPGRGVRHGGVALVVAGPGGSVTVPLGGRFDPEPTVGDWVAMVDGRPIAVLE